MVPRYWYIFLLMLFVLLSNNRCEVNLCYFFACSSPPVQSFQTKSFPLPFFDGCLHPFIRATYFTGRWNYHCHILALVVSELQDRRSFIAKLFVIWLVSSLLYETENHHFPHLFICIFIAFTSMYHFMLGANLRIYSSFSLWHSALIHICLEFNAKTDKISTFLPLSRVACQLCFSCWPRSKYDASMATFHIPFDEQEKNIGVKTMKLNSSYWQVQLNLNFTAS